MDFILYVAWATVVAIAVGALLMATRRSASRRRDAAPSAPAKARRAVATDTGAGPAPAPEASSAPAPARPVPDELVRLRLLDEQSIPAERKAELGEQLRQIAMPPRGLQRFMSADIMSGTASRELAELVMSEPRLAAKVLGRANSPFYGLQSPIASIPHAITYLGMNAVRSMAISFLLEESFTVEDPALRRYCDRVWASGMVASELCALLATKLGFGDTGVLCTQTILSFLGELAVPSLLPGKADALRELGLVDRLRFEQEHIGANAVLLGTIMMREWGLPQGVVDEVAASGRIVVTPCGQGDPALAARRALTYTCARIGEAIAQGMIDRPEQIDVGNAEGAEFYHLEGYLRLPALARLPEQLHAPDVRLVLMRMIASAGSETDAGRAGEKLSA